MDSHRPGEAAAAATVSGADDELRWDFERRQLVDRGGLAAALALRSAAPPHVASVLRFACHERLYTDWLATGHIDAATLGWPTGDSTGILITEVLPSPASSSARCRVSHEQGPA
jgi:hypothetical protein